MYWPIKAVIRALTLAKCLKTANDQGRLYAVKRGTISLYLVLCVKKMSRVELFYIG